MAKKVYREDDPKYCRELSVEGDRDFCLNKYWQGKAIEKDDLAVCEKANEDYVSECKDWVWRNRAKGKLDVGLCEIEGDSRGLDFSPTKTRKRISGAWTLVQLKRDSVTLCMDNFLFILWD